MASNQAKVEQLQEQLKFQQSEIHRLNEINQRLSYANKEQAEVISGLH